MAGAGENKIGLEASAQSRDVVATMCAHPGCSCPAMPGSKYCSAQCAAMEDIPDIDCRCNHSNCKGKAH